MAYYNQQQPNNGYGGGGDWGEQYPQQQQQYDRFGGPIGGPPPQQYDRFGAPAQPQYDSYGASAAQQPLYDNYVSPPPQSQPMAQYDRFGVPIQQAQYDPYGGNGYEAPPVSPPMSMGQEPMYQNQINNVQNNGGYNNGYQAQAPAQSVYPKPTSNQHNNGAAGSVYSNSTSSNANVHYRDPPSKAQSFGVKGYNFQYSTCTGRRKALLIGINYVGQKNALRGCINDVQNVHRFLLKHGYKDQDMVILTDDQKDPRCNPTRENMLRGMRWLVKDAKPNDSLFMHYSGHGGQTEDLDGDEDDGFDEVIYPVDYQRAGHIVDDEMYNILIRPIAPGVRLTCLFDSCHSGTVLDLPYVYSSKGVLKEPNLLKEAGSGLLNAVMTFSQGGDMTKVMNSVTSLLKRAAGSGNAAAANEKTKQTKTAPCDAIMISGCKDSQTSADAFENGKATGAMSHAFISVMSQNPNQSYISLLGQMRIELQGKYEQKPQLSASHPIDCNLKFIF